MTLLLSGSYRWEAEPGGCHGVAPLEDLKVGAPVTVSSGGRTLVTGAVTRSKNWIASCTLTADIDAVPAAPLYTFRFAGYTGHMVPYESVAKTWTVLLSKP